jgi:isoamylase
MANFGAFYDSTASEITFRVFSASAIRVELWIYAQPTGAPENIRLQMMPTAANPQVFVQTVTIADLGTAGVTGTVYYGYRAWGPNWVFDPSWSPGSAAGFIADCDGAGNRFNPNKLLIDPYTRETSHDPLTPAANDASIYMSGATNRNTDSARLAPKAIVLSALPSSPTAAARPTRALKDEVIYEVHVRGLTKNDPIVPTILQGTFAGAAMKAPALKQLGITAIEFLPLQESQNETNDVQQSTVNCNYWGYEPYAFFAPDRRYASDQSPGGPTRELKQMIDAFHTEGIKVFCDVIFNHGGEGDVDGTTGTISKIFSLRGLDNSTYYEVQDGNAGYQNVRLNSAPGMFFRNDNGVSPNLNAASWAVRELILDFLKYWHGDLGVDGFRFDLAAILGNESTRNDFVFSSSDAQGVLQRALVELPARPAAGGAGVDLIAEPYTANEAGQEQGKFPNGWAEWNDNFRDVFRASQNKIGFSSVTTGQMATKFAGSQDRFGLSGRQPPASINFITCHDGFSLRDLYSNTFTHNDLPFPFGPSPGGRSAAAEMCWDQDGDVALQQQAARNGLALVLLSAGVPMFCGGDELYRTQYGNNNMFNVDTSKNWLDPAAGATFSDQAVYVRRLVAFRNAHPCLRPARFFQGIDHNGNSLKDLTWYQDDGTEVGQDYFANPSNHYLSYRIDGSEFGDPAASLLVIYNSHYGDITAVLPVNLPAKQWILLADTSPRLQSQQHFFEVASGQAIAARTYNVIARSVVVMVE